MGNSTSKMIRIAVLGALACVAISAPDYGGAGFIKVELANSYGPPKEEVCYPKYVTKTMTKDVQGTSGYYATVTKEVPTTIYAYITETSAVYATKTVTQSYPMTHYVTKTGYETKG